MSIFFTNNQFFLHVTLIYQLYFRKRLKERCCYLCKNGEIKKENFKKEIKTTIQDSCISSPLDSTTYTTERTSPCSILTPSAPGKLRSDVLTETVSGSSSAESCKVPVAPWEEVAVEIKDGDEGEVICKRESLSEENCTSESFSSSSVNQNSSTKSSDMYNIGE